MLNSNLFPILTNKCPEYKYTNTNKTIWTMVLFSLGYIPSVYDCLYSNASVNLAY